MWQTIYIYNYVLKKLAEKSALKRTFTGMWNQCAVPRTATRQLRQFDNYRALQGEQVQFTYIQLDSTRVSLHKKLKMDLNDEKNRNSKCIVFFFKS